MSSGHGNGVLDLLVFSMNSITERIKQKKIVVFSCVSLSLIFLIGILLFVKSRVDRHNPDEIHIHASFLVFVDDEIQNYSEPKYMHLLPCGLDNVLEDEQIMKAHLHDNIGEVVHVHRRGAVWRDLFTNMNIDIDENVKAYIDGVETPRILDREIMAYNRVLFLIGENTQIDQKLKVVPSVERIQEVEQYSESCGAD